MILRCLLVLVVSVAAVSAQDTAPPDSTATIPVPAVPEREPYRDPTWAAVQGLVIPGSVHLKHGEEGWGTYHLTGAIFTLPFALGLVQIPFLDDPDFSQGIGIVSYVLGAGTAAYESYELVDRLNEENGYHLGLSDRGVPARPPGVRVTLFATRF